MDFKHKQLDLELSALNKVFSELGVRLSEVAKEVTATGVNPSEKLIEQISAARASFENVRNAVHGHATAMLVSPLPKLAELVSVAAIDSLHKASAVAEETKLSIEGEREKALAILSRALAIVHRETTDFKPLHEAHAKISELRSAISKTVWPHRHADSEALLTSKHPVTDLLHFVENLNQLDDEKYMALETALTDVYGKLLFVAASRGKLTVAADGKADKPAAPAAVSAEKPVEKKPVMEKAPEKPAPAPAPVVQAAPPVAVVEKKPAVPPASVAPAAPAPVPAAQKPVSTPAAPPAVNPAPTVSAAPTVAVQTPAVQPERKPAPAPAVPAAAASTPVVPQATVAPAAAPVGVPASPAPAPAPAVATAPGSALAVTMNSLSALASATEPAEKKPAPAPADIDKQRKEPRLASPPAPASVSVSASKPEPKAQETPDAAQQEALQQGLAGDGSQRPQRWGFWRGNR